MRVIPLSIYLMVAVTPKKNPKFWKDDLQCSICFVIYLWVHIYWPPLEVMRRIRKWENETFALSKKGTKMNIEGKLEYWFFVDILILKIFFWNKLWKILPIMFSIIFSSSPSHFVFISFIRSWRIRSTIFSIFLPTSSILAVHFASRSCTLDSSLFSSWSCASFIHPTWDSSRDL